MELPHDALSLITTHLSIREMASFGCCCKHIYEYTMPIVDVLRVELLTALRKIRRSLLITAPGLIDNLHLFEFNKGGFRVILKFSIHYSTIKFMMKTMKGGFARCLYYKHRFETPVELISFLKKLIIKDSDYMYVVLFPTKAKQHVKTKL